jgi:hypothetical protein
LRKQLKAIKPLNPLFFQKISSKCAYSLSVWVARGAGFEPARPLRTTGLAGLGFFDFLNCPLPG